MKATLFTKLIILLQSQHPWQPQVQMPQPSFQQVSYPGFGQQNPKAFAYQNNPYLVYQQKIPYVGAQNLISQEIPS